MPYSAIMSFVPITIQKLDSELNDVKSDEGVLASSNIYCVGLDSDTIGCHLVSDGFMPAELHNVQFGDVSTKESEADLLAEASLCVPRQGSQMDANAQHEVHGECAVALMVSTDECHPRVSHLGLTQQFPQRSVVVVPNSDARSGLSMEHVDGPKAITWSSVVTKNTLGACSLSKWTDSPGSSVVSSSVKPSIFADSASPLRSSVVLWGFTVDDPLTRFGIQMPRPHLMRLAPFRFLLLSEPLLRLCSALPCADAHWYDMADTNFDVVATDAGVHVALDVSCCLALV
ncbi:hypothetical protein Nepgr_018733 [Nepenthes gracilis]|uniref:Uncharacterized protein n=1 Tax=Nepenthes gracilis TaxID=150966 RepID=A0AAD3SUQ3_NEPGR|nr:hypothetical protein Nepgr_018733 [Nepenthes gracilis]